MKQLLHILDQVPEFQQLLDALDAGRSPAAVSGLSPVHRAHFAAGIRRHWDCPVVMVCADEEEGRRLAADLTAFTGEEVTLLAAREFLFHDSAVASRQWEHRRLAAFHAMARGQAPLIVATVEGLLQRTLSPEELAEHTVTIENGGQYDLDRLADQLSALGYTRCEQVEGVGQFALRGGILDVYSPAQDHPVRIEFWDTDVDSMGLFDVGSQRRVARLDRAVFHRRARPCPPGMKTASGSAPPTGCSPPDTSVSPPPPTTCLPGRWCAFPSLAGWQSGPKPGCGS